MMELLLGLLILPDGSEVRQDPDKILDHKYLVLVVMHLNVHNTDIQLRVLEVLILNTNSNYSNFRSGNIDGRYNTF